MAPRSYNYGWGYPVPVFMFVVVLVYSTIAPMILVLGAVYFCMAYLVLKYQLLYGKKQKQKQKQTNTNQLLTPLVYFHSYEVAGRMWPLVFSRIILGLLIFELTSAGLFILNKSYPLAGLCLPLIILTVGFKLVMDAAYQRSTQYLPLQLLSEKLGPVTTVVPPENSNEPTSSDPNSGNTNNKDRSNSIHPLNTDDIAKPPRRRRTVLDEDDYVADPRKNTDFREPPMTLVDGILNTGMKRYGHPAMVGVLPQLWLPIKAGAEKDRAISLRREDFSEGSSSSSITVPQPIRKRTGI
jgi:hypothetical protein